MRKFTSMSNILPKPMDRPNVLEHVSENVRRLRKALGMSQDALASESGVSRRMIVGIEAGDVNVSLATLDRIAEALGVLFPDLVQAPSRPDRSRIEAVAWVGEDPRSRAVLLASAPARREVELWSWALEPGERYASEADAEGWREMVYVIEGELTLELPEGPVTVRAGDFHVFASSRPYVYSNRGTVPLRYLRNVVS